MRISKNPNVLKNDYVRFFIFDKCIYFLNHILNAQLYVRTTVINYTLFNKFAFLENGKSGMSRTRIER